MAMAGMPDVVNVEALVVDFMGDPAMSSIELPHMTTGQRKSTKKLLEQYPDLKCESFGFGKDRRLHLFKDKLQLVGESSRKVSDTPVDASEQNDLAVEEAPTTGCGRAGEHDTAPEETLHSIKEDGPVAKLDLAAIKNFLSARAEASSIDGSTVAPSSCASDCSPASTFRGMPSWFRLPPGLELEVQNTFIHYKGPPSDQRAVQSMPHCMFQKCLLSEALSGSATKDNVTPTVEGAADGVKPTASADVVIEGLTKLPEFNGLKGTLQSLEPNEQDGRYSILLPSPVRGHKTVKVKRENFRFVCATERPSFPSECKSAPRPLKLTALV